MRAERVDQVAWPAGRAGVLVRGWEVDLRGRWGEKCLSSNRGAMVLSWNVCARAGAERWEGDFSGYRTPGRMKEAWRWLGVCGVLGKRLEQSVAAAAMVDSSGWGVSGFWIVGWWWLWLLLGLCL